MWTSEEYVFENMVTTVCYFINSENVHACWDTLKSLFFFIRVTINPKNKDLFLTCFIFGSKKHIGEKMEAKFYPRKMSFFNGCQHTEREKSVWIKKSPSLYLKPYSKCLMTSPCIWLTVCLQLTKRDYYAIYFSSAYICFTGMGHEFHSLLGVTFLFILHSEYSNIFCFFVWFFFLKSQRLWFLNIEQSWRFDTFYILHW